MRSIMNIGTKLVQSFIKLDLFGSGQSTVSVANSFREVKCNGPPGSFAVEQTTQKGGISQKENSRRVASTPRPSRSPGAVDRNFYGYSIWGGQHLTGCQLWNIPGCPPVGTFVLGTYFWRQPWRTQTGECS